MGRAANRLRPLADYVRRSTGSRPAVRARLWNPERVHRELAAFLVGREHWPSVDEFRAGGAMALYHAILSHGGAGYWQQAFEFPPRPTKRGAPQGQLRRPSRWSHERIEASLSRFLGERHDWPLTREFEQAGLQRLYRAVLDHGGAAYWAEKMGVALAYGQGGRRYNDEDAVRDARAVIAARGQLPNEKTLRVLGYGHLSQAVGRAGGARAFACRHGLPTR